MAAGKGVDEEAMALERIQLLQQQAAGRRQGRQAALGMQHRPGGLQLGLVGPGRAAVLCHARQHRPGGLGQLGRQGHLAAGPGRHDATLAHRLAHKGRHVLGAHEPQHPATEDEAIARLEPGDEALRHLAQRATAAAGLGPPLHQHRRFADAGAHQQPVALGDAAVGHPPGAVDPGHAVVLGVGAQ